MGGLKALSTFLQHISTGLTWINTQVMSQVQGGGHLHGMLVRCDRILSYGKGMRLLSYDTVDLRQSDHRPVKALYKVDVEVFCPKKLQRALTFTDAEVDDQLSFEGESTSGVYTALGYD